MRNVTTIVGLRAYSAQSNILPRNKTLGARLAARCTGLGMRQTVVRARNAFMDFVETIKQEGVTLDTQADGRRRYASYETPLVVEVAQREREEDIDALDIDISGAASPAGRFYREYKEPRRTGCGRAGASTRGLSTVQAGRNPRDCLQGHHHRRGDASPPSSTRLWALPIIWRVGYFAQPTDERLATGRRATTCCMARSRCLFGTSCLTGAVNLGKPQRPAQSVRAGRRKNAARNIQEGDQCVDRAGQRRDAD